jgi:predicted AlkP superfamily pyrophosphatase or phosphodiesterase
VSWPVIGARGISWLIPEYWRASTDEDLKLMRALSTPGMMKELEPQAGRYETDLDNAIPGDWARTHYAEAIIRRKHARFMTVHLAALDHMEHESGPFSPDANSALEEIDRMVGMLARAMRDETRNTAICIVSDHGFAAIDHQLNIAVPFVKAGLITLNQGKTTTVKDWTASPWNSGGVAFVVSKDPRDQKVRGMVEKLLHELSADPANGVNQILDRAEIAAMGGAANAEFAVDMTPGFSLGGALDGPAVREIKHGGTHGYSPAHPEMLAAFLISGPGIRQNFDLGEIDMRSIAPTLASYLGASLTSGDLPALNIAEAGSAAAKR